MDDVNARLRELAKEIRFCGASMTIDTLFDSPGVQMQKIVAFHNMLVRVYSQPQAED